MCFKIFYFGWVTHEKCTRDILTNLSGQFTAWSEEVWSVSFYSFQFAPYTRWPPSYPTQLYIEQPSGNLAEGSEICACKEGGELVCAFLEQVQSRPCNTDNIYYRSVLGQVYHWLSVACLAAMPHHSTLPTGVAASATRVTSSVPRRTLPRHSKGVKCQ